MNYTVQPGDCIGSLAEANGLLWQTVWDHSENTALKEKRKDPNILFPGDVVFIPEIRLRIETKPVDQKHKFIRKGIPAKIRLRIMKAPEPSQTAASRGTAGESGARHFEAGDPEPEPPQADEPRSNTPYVLNIDGTLTNGKTDADGYVEIPISPLAREGTLTLDPGTLKETAIPLQLGHLDPLDEISGVKQRLVNLGFGCGDLTNEVTDNFCAALSAFQEARGLEVTGELDQTTRNAIKDAHGS
jgi:hypothetical protein